MITLDTAEATVRVPMLGRIPVRNVWLLMLYASDLYRELPQAESVEVEDDPDELPNLIAEILTHAVERRLRRNLSFGYRRRHADLTRVRGRINLLRTERRQLIRQGRIACAFDELTVDTPRNRFVRAALNLLSRIAGDDDLAYRCRAASSMMERAGVSGDPALTTRRPPQTPMSHLGRLGSDDRRMLAAARLAFDLALPTEDAGLAHVVMPDRDGNLRWYLYERAIAGFYDVVLERQGWTVRPQRWLHWQVGERSQGISDYLPSMQADIKLERPLSDAQAPGHQIVIDTKFMPILTSGYGGGQRFKSANIYQLYAYLRSQERDGDARSLDSDGILLYPSVGEDFDEWAVIQGHRIRFATVDLAADSAEIRQRLLQIVGASVQ